MKIEGGCHCGYIRYAAVVDPERVAICHCTDCQIMSGSAFRIVVFAPREAFTLLAGQPKVYVKPADSGARRAQAFCPECGTGIHSSDVDHPTYLGIRAGTARQRAELIPKYQIWCRSALPWLKDATTTPAFELQPPLPR